MNKFMIHCAVLVHVLETMKNVRFEVFLVVKIQVQVFQVVTLCSVVVGYQYFRGPCCPCLNSEVTGCHNPEVLNFNEKCAVGLGKSS
jgi:hypothetical protein